MRRQLGSSSERFKALGCASFVADGLCEFFLGCPPVHSGGLYHYTCLAVAKKIIDGRCLLLSSSRRLNDTREPQDDGLYVASFSFGAIENVAMWGIYSRPLSEAVRLRFRYAEMREMARRCRGSICPVAVRQQDKKMEYRVLENGAFAVDLKEDAHLSDILYVDHVEEKSRRNDGRVAIRWNSNSIRISLRELDSVRSSPLKKFIKYSGWAYERETRLCVNVTIDDEKAKRALDALGNGWKLTKDKIALRLPPKDSFGMDVRCGPCLPSDKIEHAFAGGAANNGRIEASILKDCVRGGVFCDNCPRAKRCRTLNPD